MNRFTCFGATRLCPTDGSLQKIRTSEAVKKETGKVIEHLETAYTELQQSRGEWVGQVLETLLSAQGGPRSCVN